MMTRWNPAIALGVPLRYMLLEAQVAHRALIDLVASLDLSRRCHENRVANLPYTRLSLVLVLQQLLQNLEFDRFGKKL